MHQSQVSPQETAEKSQTSHEDNSPHVKEHGDLQVNIRPGDSNVKLAKDGRTVLIPQPSDDPDDVLNWTAGRKNRVLLSLIFASFVCATLTS